MSFSITRYHDISAGHRVDGHEGKCALLHGHNYRIHFTVEPVSKLDDLGRVVDFGVIKARLCNWLEENWDHKFLAWKEDKLIDSLYTLVAGRMPFKDALTFQKSIVRVPFNPTAENMARYLVEQIGPELLWETDTVLVQVTIDETRKCSATYRRSHGTPVG